MDYETILFDVQDRVLTITFNRPEVMNATNAQTYLDVYGALDRAEADDDIRVVIFTGRGRAFCAGADLSGGPDTFNAGARGTANELEHRDGGGKLTLRLYDFKKPVIAAINGAAVGVGITMTLAMDIRMASEQARMGFVFARRGIVMEAASSWFLPRAVSLQQAAEWCYTGRVFNAQEALKGGLLRSVHAPEELLPAARALATEIADNTSAMSVTLVKQMMWKMLGADHPMEAHRMDSRLMYFMGQAPDVKEGILSFQEKRAPAFTMKVSTDLPPFYPWWDERAFRRDG